MGAHRQANKVGKRVVKRWRIDWTDEPGKGYCSSYFSEQDAIAFAKQLGWWVVWYRDNRMCTQLLGNREIAIGYAIAIRENIPRSNPRVIEQFLEASEVSNEENIR
jgi:hypothetical protein